MIIKIVLLILLYLFIGGIIAGIFDFNFPEEEESFYFILSWPIVIIFCIPLFGYCIAKTVEKLIVRDDDD